MSIGLKYRSLKRYKYQLMEPIQVHIDLPCILLKTKYFELNDGIMTIYEGYAWDGPSGPTFDTPSFMRGSLVHDVLYQAMRLGQLPHGYRLRADGILGDICKQDGMSRFRCWYVVRALRAFGQKAATKKRKSEIISI